MRETKSFPRYIVCGNRKMVRSKHLYMKNQAKLRDRSFGNGKEFEKT